MKVVLAGGSGQAGRLLARELGAANHSVVVLSRGEPDPDGTPRTVNWDARTLGEWADEVDGAGAVINLAGRSINCRHTLANQRLMRESRLEATRVIGRAINAAARPPKVWLNASAATLYSHVTDRPHDETSGVIGGAEPGLPPKWRFILQLVKDWEAAQTEADTPKTRKVALRTTLLLGVGKGGVFDTLYTLVRLGLGGKVGDGRQYVSWIHEQDFARAVMWLLEHDTVEGPVNLATPGPLTNADFMAVLRTVQGMPFGLPTPAPLLELGAWLMRTESKLVLKSRRVRPGRLLESGFEFLYPDWEDAARELVSRRSL
jgi:uncharacterized protein (TIGR01777 family)